MAGLVQELPKVRDPRPAVARDDPLFAGRPAIRTAARDPDVEHERHRDRSAAGSRRDVVADPERLRIGTERRVVRPVDPAQLGQRQVRVERPAERARRVALVPGLDRAAGPRTDRRSRQAARIARSQGSSSAGSTPSARAFASTGDPSRRHASALAWSAMRYGLAGPPSPSTACQIGSSARKRRRRVPGSGSVASRPRISVRPTGRPSNRRSSAARVKAAADLPRSAPSPSFARMSSAGRSSGSAVSIAIVTIGSSDASRSRVSRIDATARRSSASRPSTDRAAMPVTAASIAALAVARAPATAGGSSAWRIATISARLCASQAAANASSTASIALIRRPSPRPRGSPPGDARSGPSGRRCRGRTGRPGRFRGRIRRCRSRSCRRAPSRPRGP